MSKRIFAAVLALALLLSGCAYGGGGEEGLYTGVYRLNTSGSGGDMLTEQWVAYTPEDNVLDVIMNALNSVPELPGMGRVFPADVRMESISIERGVASVEMNGAYTLLTGTERLLCESAIVLSLSDLDSVCDVEIKCGGKLCARELRVENIRRSDPVFEKGSSVIKLYLPTEDMAALTPRTLRVETDGAADSREMIVSRVLEALPVATDKTILLSVETLDGVCTVDLSEDFYGNEPADPVPAMLYIYSIVNSLCRLESVDSVVITVEGQSMRSYGGFRPQWPLSENMDIIVY